MSTSAENQAAVVAAQKALDAANRSGDAAKIAAATQALAQAQAAEPK